jgi:hypothetical protein
LEDRPQAVGIGPQPATAFGREIARATKEHHTMPNDLNVVALRNRHPADELADVRADIKRLELRELALRQQLVESPAADRAGELFIAKVSPYTKQHLDAAALRRHFGEAALAPFYRQPGGAVVRLSRKKIPTPAPRSRSQRP